MLQTPAILALIASVVVAGAAWSQEQPGSVAAHNPAAPVEAASRGEAPPLAKLDVQSARPVPLDEKDQWTKIPDFLEGAQVYSKDSTGRQLKCEVKSDGLVIVAVSWTYDGNDSDGWRQSHTPREKLIEQGWQSIGQVTWMEQDTHELFFKHARAGEMILFHTRKYNQPFVVIPLPERLADVKELLKPPKKPEKPIQVAQASDKPASPAPPPATPPDKSTPMPVPAAAPTTPELKEIAVTAAEPKPVSKEEWPSLPEYLNGATVLAPKDTNTIELTAKEDVQVIVAASWGYDGNRGGGWFETRTILPQLVSEGWQPVGTVTQKDTSKDGTHTLFRRTLKAGDTIKFHTRKYLAPVVFLPSKERATALAKASPILSASNNLAAIAPPKPGPSAASGKAVLLRTHEPDLEDRFADRGLLLRELVRQAILIAARDELGLATRDNSLCEDMTGDQKGPLPLDVVVHVQQDKRINITLFRHAGGKPEVLWDKHFALEGDDLIVALTKEAELKSRTEWLDALNKAGFKGPANKVQEKSSLDPHTQKLLADLHFLPQFVAVRQLHELMRRDGESPERLVALARGYAHLSVLTEQLWHPADKVFMARALLYAERAAARWPDSTMCLQGRAYARGLGGLHQAALDDLAAVDRSAAGKPVAGQRSQVLQAIEALCQFDYEKLEELGRQPQLSAFVRLLELLSTERFASPGTIVDRANRLLQEVPDCDRAYHAIYETHQLGTRAQAAELGMQRMDDSLYNRLQQVEDQLPRQVVSIVRAEARTRVPAIDGAGDAGRRIELVRAFREAGAVESDAGEPSWQTMGTLLEEVTFAHVCRQLEYLSSSLGVPVDDVLPQLLPQVADHPQILFIESLTDNRRVRRAKILELMKVLRPEELSPDAWFLTLHINSEDIPEFIRLDGAAGRHRDKTYRDLLLRSREIREVAWVENASELRRVSPHSPYSIAVTIQYDWKAAEPKVA